jgi:hypothetical protein
LADALAEVKALAGKCADAPTWPLSDDALVECLDTIHHIAQAVTAAQLHLVREIDGRGLPVAQHASGTAVWLREHLRISIHTANGWSSWPRRSTSDPPSTRPWPPAR